MGSITCTRCSSLSGPATWRALSITMADSSVRSMATRILLYPLMVSRSCPMELIRLRHLIRMIDAGQATHGLQLSQQSQRGPLRLGPGAQWRCLARCYGRLDPDTPQHVDDLA